jgi:hypothetical protein
MLCRCTRAGCFRPLAKAKSILHRNNVISSQSLSSRLFFQSPHDAATDEPVLHICLSKFTTLLSCKHMRLARISSVSEPQRVTRSVYSEPSTWNNYSHLFTHLFVFQSRCGDAQITLMSLNSSLIDGSSDSMLAEVVHGAQF